MLAARVAVVLVVLAVSAPAVASEWARGNVPFVGLHLRTPSAGTQLSSQSAAFDCRTAPVDRRCTFELTYLIRSGAEAVELELAFVGRAYQEVRFALDGTELAATGADAASNDETLHVLVNGHPSSMNRRPVRQVPFALTLPPNSSRALRISGALEVELRPARTPVPYPAIMWRHPVLARWPEGDAFFEVDVVTGLKGVASSDGSVVVEVLAPVGWAVGTVEDRFGPNPPSAEGWVDGTRELPASGTPQVLNIASSTSAPLIYPGGIQLALGGTVSRETGSYEPAFLLRAGYQLAAPVSLLHSLSVDWDLRRQVVLTPLTQRVFREDTIITPSIGLGLPVQVLPELRPGVRLLADTHISLLGLVLTVDVYPPLRSDLAFLAQGAIALQLSL